MKTHFDPDWKKPDYPEWAPAFYGEKPHGVPVFRNQFNRTGHQQTANVSRIPAS